MKQIYTLAIIIAGFLFSPVAWGQKDFQHHKDSLLNIIASVEGQAKISAYYDLTSFLYFNE
ncbi:hypothetical protein AGMMS50239_28960 [Bacteroidia bacterium]|nr:hypothetical protein AGMMS50239_28960 [Bacteroidia bacterium]